jgi:hypothetical protein
MLLFKKNVFTYTANKNYHPEKNYTSAAESMVTDSVGSVRDGKSKFSLGFL